MTIAEAPRRTRNPNDASPRATTPFRIYAADHQPIRLLAELGGISPAELVHRALVAYVRNERTHLAQAADLAREAFESGNYELLRDGFSSTARARDLRRQQRLEKLSRTGEDL